MVRIAPSISLPAMHNAGSLHSSDISTVVQVFVAGATGNTGKRVVQQLSAKGIKVLAGTRVSSLPCCLEWLSFLTPSSKRIAAPVVVKRPLYQQLPCLLPAPLWLRLISCTRLPDQLCRIKPDAGSQKGRRSWMG